VVLDTGETVTTELVERLADEEINALPDSLRYQSARALFLQVALADEYVDFLTIPAYERFG